MKRVKQPICAREKSPRLPASKFPTGCGPNIDFHFAFQFAENGIKNYDLLLSREKRDIAITFVCLFVCLFVC